MNIVTKSADILAAAAKGNPAISTVVIIMFHIVFTLFEAGIENLVFGGRFEHWLDPIFTMIFIAYAAYAVCACAKYNTNKATWAAGKQ